MSDESGMCPSWKELFKLVGVAAIAVCVLAAVVVVCVRLIVVTLWVP